MGPCYAMCKVMSRLQLQWLYLLVNKITLMCATEISSLSKMKWNGSGAWLNIFSLCSLLGSLLELIHWSLSILFCPEWFPLQNQPALLGTSGGVRRVPLWSPQFPSGAISGRVTGVGNRGCIEGMGGLTGMGVRMGMADIADMDDRPIDRFGIEPIPIWRKHTKKINHFVIFSNA